MKKLVKFLLFGFLLNFTFSLDAGTVKIRQVGQPDVYVPTMDSTNSSNLTVSGNLVLSGPSSNLTLSGGSSNLNLSGGLNLSGTSSSFTMSGATSSVTMSGGIIYHTRSVSSATVLLMTDYYVLVTSNVSVTLPAQVNGRIIHIKRNTSAGFVTVLPGSGTIDGASNYILSANYQSVSLITDGSNWYVM